jgi:uncharacterized protein YndB with AHSA1/START domain
VTTWCVDAPPEKVWAVLGEAEQYPSWWPGVENVEVRQRGAPDGTGKRVRLTLRSTLPYRLRFDTVARELREPNRITFDALGDLTGTGRWELHADGGVTTATHVWDVTTTKTWMRLLDPFLRPAFVWNHHVVMRRGGEGLARHLGGRLVSRTEEPPLRAADWAPLLGLGLSVAALAAWGWRRRR